MGESPGLATVRDGSRPLEADRGAELEAAIARLTRALATADDHTIPDLVTERRAMREELDALTRPDNVVEIRKVPSVQR